MEASEDIASLQNKLSITEKELSKTESEIQVLVQKRKELRKKEDQLKGHIQSLTDRYVQGHDMTKEFEWSASLIKFKTSVFKIDQLRPLQLEVMNTTLSGLDCIVIMPTGGGKSLCYQLPALVSDGLTVVITPLVSLMEDQCFALERLGIHAVNLHANTPKDLVNTVHNDMAKKSSLRMLYVTPEKISKSKRFMNKLELCYKNGNLKRIAIDEVHCCSQWGHDFRPDYKILGILKRQFPKTPILGLTATASADLLMDVKAILNITHAQTYRSSFNRPNLYYSVKLKPFKFDESVTSIAKYVQTNHPESSGLVYCISRKDTETLATALSKLGIKCGCYHGDLPAAIRSTVHTKWISGRIKLIVATIAFGMGIDKPDVRYVIHHGMSKSLENYYQESGRAGRDGERAECILYFNLVDYFRQSCMVFTEAAGLQKLYGMLRYALSSQCKRKVIAEHFSEVWREDMICNRMCDSCAHNTQIPRVDVTRCQSDIQRVFQVLDDKPAETRITFKMLMDNLYKRATPGKSDLNRGQYEILIGHLLVNQNLREDFYFTPYSTISYLEVGSRNTDELKKSGTCKSTTISAHQPTTSGATVSLPDTSSQPPKKRQKTEHKHKHKEQKIKNITRNTSTSSSKQDLIVLGDSD